MNGIRNPDKSLAARIGLLGETLQPSSPLAVVDIGANPLNTPPYAALMRAGGCQVFGFEPQQDAYAALIAAAAENEHYVNAAVGPAGQRSFNLYTGAGFASLFKLHAPSLAFLSRFQRQLKQHRQVEVTLTPLDDVAEIARIDLLKMDVQGAERDILRSGRTKLRDCVVVIPEMRFHRLYEDEPHLGDLDSELRAQGFVLHKFLDAKAVPLRNSQTDRLITGRMRNQLVDGDAVYIRDMTQPDEWLTDQLIYLAMGAGLVFDSQDLCLRCLDLLVARGDAAADLPGRYADRLPSTDLKPEPVAAKAAVED